MTVCVSGPVSKTLRDPVAVCVGGCSFSKTKSWQDAPAPPRCPLRLASGPRWGEWGATLRASAGAAPPPPARVARAGIVSRVVYSRAPYK